MEEDRSLMPLEESLLDAQIHEADLERREFIAESERLRAAARKLVEESQRLEADARTANAKQSAQSRLVKALKCEKTLHCLRRNDPETRVVDLARYKGSNGYGKVLGEALEGNTVVSELILNGPMLLLPKDSCAISLSLIEKLLQFLSTSASLRRVYLGHPTWDDRASFGVAFDLTGMIVDAILTNSNIVDLSLNVPRVNVWLHRIADAKLPLTTLTLWFLGHLDLTRQDIPPVPTCIASLAHLENLNLFVERNRSLPTAILTRLSNADSRLRSLRLVTKTELDRPFFTALGQFLSSTTRLDHLELSGVGLYGTDDMGDVVRGLQHVDDETGVTSIFVSRLCFAKFVCSVDGFAHMTAFLMTKIHRNGAVTCRSALNELFFHPGKQAGLARRGAWQLANSLLMARVSMNGSGSDADEKLVQTVGSQVRSISLARVHCIFLDHLGRHAHRVQLESLELIDVPEDTGVALGTCLPKLQYLKVLKLVMVGTGSPYWILRGLRQNGTLLNVEMTNEEEYSNFDAAQLILVEAYCQRNTLLGELLDKETGQAWHVFPSLLQVAKQAPMTLVTNLVRGLLRYEQ
jgi:hypothetical protein